jgi:hypothetical protein
MRKRKVIVTLRELPDEALEALVPRLREAGLTDDNVLPILGIITGEADDEAVAALSELDDVEAVRDDVEATHQAV